MEIHFVSLLDSCVKRRKKGKRRCVRIRNGKWENLMFSCDFGVNIREFYFNMIC